MELPATKNIIVLLSTVNWLNDSGFNVPPTTKVLWTSVDSLIRRTGEAWIEPATPGLQGEQLNHCTTEASEYCKTILEKVE